VAIQNVIFPANSSSIEFGELPATVLPEGKTLIDGSLGFVYEII
jgi:hypothetical protein